MYRAEAVGLSFSNDTEKNDNFFEYVKVGGNFVRIWNLINNCLIKLQI